MPAGIVSFGGYVPAIRISRDMIAEAWGSASIGGEKAVSNHDEDAITMAVAAARDALTPIKRENVGGLYFASTTSPYVEKSASSIIALATDVPRDIDTADFGGSLRAGSAGLKAALRAVDSGATKHALVTVADTRLGAPQSMDEQLLGDGAAAFMIGDQKIVAKIVAQASISDETIDVWRTKQDDFIQSWEDRFILQHGYQDQMLEVIRKVLAKVSIKAEGITKLVAYGPTVRSQQGLARAAGFDPKTQLYDGGLLRAVGNTGAAFGPMMLVAALEDSAPGDHILWVNYGDGADAFLFQVMAPIKQLKRGRGISGHLGYKLPMKNYEHYARHRRLIGAGRNRKAPGGTSVTIHWRERDDLLPLHGVKCRKCGAEQFPRQRVCHSCQTLDQMESVALADRPSRVFTYTKDNLTGLPDPPEVMTVIEVEGGARVYAQMTDRDPDQIQLEMPVEWTFRKIHEAGGLHNYFWKCRPMLA